MDKGRTGRVERYILGDTRMTKGLKGTVFTCRRIALTQPSMSSMKEGMRSRKRLAKVIRSFEDNFFY